jgi:hypothetical protein
MTKKIVLAARYSLDWRRQKWKGEAARKLLSTRRDSTKRKK